MNTEASTAKTRPSAKAKKMNGDDAATNRMWKYIIGVSVPVTIIVGATLFNLLVRVNGIESNRFTAQDGIHMEKELKSWIENRFPPEWMRDDIKEIKELVRENGMKIETHLIKHKE